MRRPGHCGNDPLDHNLPTAMTTSIRQNDLIESIAAALQYIS